RRDRAGSCSARRPDRLGSLRAAERDLLGSRAAVARAPSDRADPSAARSRRNGLPRPRRAVSGMRMQPSDAAPDSQTGVRSGAQRGARDAAEREVVVLAGGVGAARFLLGVVQLVAAERLTIAVTTGDDRSFYGVHGSPDLDIVTYTLAGRIDRERGFGLAGDRFTLIERLAALGHETWFRLG